MTFRQMSLLYVTVTGCEVVTPMTSAGLTPMTSAGLTPMTSAGSTPMTNAGLTPMTSAGDSDIRVGAAVFVCLGAVGGPHLHGRRTEEKQNTLAGPLRNAGHIDGRDWAKAGHFDRRLE